MKAYNFVGMKFGKLTVIGRAPSKKYGKGSYISFWYCTCDCQLQLPENEREIITVSGANLKLGKTVSCGCYKREWAKKVNKYEVSGNVVKMYDSNGKEFLIDLDDLERVKQYCWSLNSHGYVRTTLPMGMSKNRYISLHRYIMNCTDPSKYVDHINHNTCDNRKVNLRICTPTQNCHNSKPGVKNKTGIRGVHFEKSKNKWMAVININKTRHVIGLYTDINDAIEARKKYEELYYGDYRYTEKLN